MTDQAEADRRHRGTEHAARGGMEHRSAQDRDVDRPQRERERARADQRDRNRGHEALRARRIDDRTARHLSEQADQAPDREHEADIDLGPRHRREIDRDERPETSLHIGDEEHEPVEAVLARLRRMRRLAVARPRRPADKASRSNAGLDTVPPLRSGGQRHFSCACAGMAGALVGSLVGSWPG